MSDYYVLNIGSIEPWVVNMEGSRSLEHCRALVAWQAEGGFHPGHYIACTYEPKYGAFVACIGGEHHVAGPGPYTKEAWQAFLDRLAARPTPGFVLHLCMTCEWDCVLPQTNDGGGATLCHACIENGTETIMNRRPAKESDRPKGPDARGPKQPQQNARAGLGPVDELVRVARLAAQRFREYEAHHAAKPDLAKAVRNGDMAKALEQAAARLEGGAE